LRSRAGAIKSSSRAPWAPRTISIVKRAMAPALRGLDVDGQLLIVGASAEPLPVDTGTMIGQRLSIQGWPSGTCVDSEDTMRFSVQMGVRPMIEVMPLARAQEALERMLSGAARFRMVLSTEP